MVGETWLQYEILRELSGRAGSAEAWLARDAENDREVVLRAVPGALPLSEKVVGRFDKEARRLTSADPAGVAGILGLEQDDERAFVVLEYVPGPTLEWMLERGPLLPSEALPAAECVMEALAAGHQIGVAHCGLEPRNVKVSATGDVKVLGFWRALLDHVAGSDPERTRPEPESGRRRAGYLSPEALRGQAADSRGDVWAFGCLLYEMLTGERAFGGSTPEEVAEAILGRDPDLAILPPGLPLPTRALLRRCFQKDPGRRPAGFGPLRADLAVALRELREKAGSAETGGAGPRLREPSVLEVENDFGEPPSERETVPDTAGRTPRRVERAEPARRRERTRGASSFLRWIVVLSVAALAYLAGSATDGLDLFRFGGAFSSRGGRMVRASVVLPPGVRVSPSPRPLAVSGDDEVVVFSASRGAGGTSLWERRIDEPTARAIAGTDGGRGPFFGSGASALWFSRGGSLARVDRTRDRVRSVVDGMAMFGAALDADGSIVYSVGVGKGLVRRSEEGGIVPLTEVQGAEGETDHRWPCFLPGGREVAFTVWRTGLADASIDVVSIEDGSRRRLLSGASDPRFVDGWLFHLTKSGAFAGARLDPNPGAVPGPARTLLDDVRYHEADGAVDVAIGDEVLVYVPSSSSPDVASFAIVSNWRGLVSGSD